MRDHQVPPPFLNLDRTILRHPYCLRHTVPRVAVVETRDCQVVGRETGRVGCSFELLLLPWCFNSTAAGHMCSFRSVLEQAESSTFDGGVLAKVPMRDEAFSSGKWPDSMRVKLDSRIGHDD